MKEVVCSGELDVRRVGELKEAFFGAILENEATTVRVSKDSECDLAFLQLLCAAHRSATSLGKKFVLELEAAEKFKKTIEEAGFSRHVGCHLDCTQSCIWMHSSCR